MVLTEYQFEGSLLQTVAMCGMIAGSGSIEIRYLSPAAWKKYGIGNSKASKEETQKRVYSLYSELIGESEHVCDSVGLLLAYQNNPDIGLRKK